MNFIFLAIVFVLSCFEVTMDVLRYLIRLRFVVSGKDLNEITELSQFPEDQFIIDAFGGN